MEQLASAPPWWGQHHFTLEQTIGWRFGPLVLTVTRLAREWQIRHQSQTQWTGSDYQTAVELAAKRLDETANLKRIVCQSTPDTLQILPALADRPVVTRPTSPLLLPRGDTTTLFVSSPLWFDILLPTAKERLLELPIQRPSDTWFGPSVREGELCYAARTNSRLALDELPLRPHRALTAVTISNRGQDAMMLERLKLPVPYLSLYANAEGLLWTESLSITRGEAADTAALRIGKGAPEQAGDAIRVNTARLPADKGILIRALNAIFG